jgi:hypothetical protein
VSRKATKRTKAATALPLVSPHWWTREKTVAYCRAHRGETADIALTAAVNAGDLPVKLEWIDHQTSPPVQHRLLLSGEDYAFGPYISNNFLVIQPRRPDVPPLSPPYALFFWGPKAKELWPAEEVEPETEAQHRQKPGTKAIGNWPDLLTCEVVRVAVEEPKLIRDRSKLVTHLRRVLTAEIKGWNLTQDKAIHRELDHLFNRIVSLRSNST